MNGKTFKALLKPVEELNHQAPKELADLIHRCLEFSANKRPENVSAVQTILDKLAEDLVQKPEDSLENMEW